MPVKKTTTKTGKPAAAETPRPEVTIPSEEDSSGAQPATFEEVEQRVREREAELTLPRRAAKEKREKEILDTAATTTVESVVASIGDLRLSVNGALDGLSAALMEQTKKLGQIEEAVSLRSRQLAELYDIEVAGDTLARLIARHDQTRHELEEAAAARQRAFEESAAAQQRALDETIAAKQAEFERQTAEARAGWEIEKKRWREELEEEKARARKDWAREREEYEYTWKLRRTRDEEEYKAKRQALQASLADEKARQEAALGEREQAVAAREQELAEMRARLEAFPADLGVAVEKAREEASAAAEARARTVAELRAKDFEANEKLLKQRISTLELLVKEQATRMEEMQRELREATDKVRDIAMKAIEGASGAATLARVSEIALHQAKGRAEG